MSAFSLSFFFVSASLSVVLFVLWCVFSLFSSTSGVCLSVFSEFWFVSSLLRTFALLFSLLDELPDAVSVLFWGVSFFLLLFCFCCACFRCFIVVCIAWCVCVFLFVFRVFILIYGPKVLNI